MIATDKKQNSGRSRIVDPHFCVKRINIETYNK